MYFRMFIWLWLWLWNAPRHVERIVLEIAELHVTPIVPVRVKTVVIHRVVVTVLVDASFTVRSRASSIVAQVVRKVMDAIVAHINVCIIAQVQVLIQLQCLNAHRAIAIVTPRVIQPAIRCARLHVWAIVIRDVQMAVIPVVKIPVRIHAKAVVQIIARAVL